MSFYDDASLVFLPSGGAGKDGKAYSMKPTNGNGDFTFSRGSNLTATRVDSNGLIEKGRENLLLQSNQFDTTWTNNNSTETSGQSGYDGSSDAWLLTSLSSYASIQQNINVSGVFTISLYLKSGSNGGVLLQVIGINNSLVRFNLDNGTLISKESAVISANIESIGNGWHRASYTLNGSITTFRIYPADNTGDHSVVGSIYIQDAQLEQGLVATEYIESGASTGKAGLLENEPRFDYSGGASCPSLLLEPSRTNLIPQSEYFDSWVKVGSPTITNNYGISPEGVQNSTRFEAISDRITNNVSTINANETFSIYMKGSGTLLIQLGGVDNFYTSVTSEWVRYEFTTTQAGVNGSVQIRGNGSAVDVELYGAQYERNSYPTSYIPNHSGGSVTREADSNVASGLSSVIGQSEGTIFCELDIDNLTDGYRRIIAISDGTTDNSIQLNLSSSGSLEAYINEQGTYSVIYYGPTLATGIQKIAITYKRNEARIYRNGTLLTTDTSVVVPACSNLYLGKVPTASITSIIGNKVKQALLFDTALSDAECITLTS